MAAKENPMLLTPTPFVAPCSADERSGKSTVLDAVDFALTGSINKFSMKKLPDFALCNGHADNFRCVPRMGRQNQLRPRASGISFSQPLKATCTVFPPGSWLRTAQCCATLPARWSGAWPRPSFSILPPRWGGLTMPTTPWAPGIEVNVLDLHRLAIATAVLIQRFDKIRLQPDELHRIAAIEMAMKSSFM